MDDCKKRFVIKVDPFLSKGEKGDKGDPGAGVELSLPLSSDDVEYNGETLTDVLDGLLYEDLTINSFVGSPSTYEKGQVLTSVACTWTYNKAIETQTITGVDVTPPTLIAADRNKTVVLVNISVTTILTLTADDDTSDAIAAKTRTVTLNFYNKIHFGKAVIPGAVNDAFVLSLQGELKANRLKEFNVTTGANEYIWFACPSAYGAASFKTNGFNGGLDLLSTFNHTNASGHTEEYSVYRSTNHNLGLTFVEVE